MILVSGGSASGKSEYAEQRAMALAKGSQRPLLYLATMMPFGEDAGEKIERHHRLRAGKGFETVERYTDLAGLCEESVQENQAFVEKAKDGTVLLECLSNLTANELFGENGAGEEAEKAILEGITRLKQLARHLVLVTIDVFGDGKVYDDGTEVYRQCLGHINQSLAVMADEVVEVVYTIPLKHK
jgi:adenosylcobinamide kinase/adenosylcobinamide-phosphate guanylyltransferase